MSRDEHRSMYTDRRGFSWEIQVHHSPLKPAGLNLVQLAVESAD